MSRAQIVLVMLGLAWFSGAAGPTPFAADAASTPPPQQRWWKGNLHTHSLWSDGDDYPEMIASWYKERGYHFLAFTEHNRMPEGDHWLTVTPKRGGGAVLRKYLDRFGPAWVQVREVDGTNQVRLKPLDEVRTRFEEPDRFLLIPAMEITDRHLVAPVHLNAVNLRDGVSPAGGSNVLDVLQRNIDAVLEQRARTGQPMFPHINHPNFGWGITAEELMQVRGERFFEVYNGHPSVHNEGDAAHAGMERVWDIVLTWRLAVLGLPPMLGLAVDDSHSYHTEAVGQSNPGRGWVMVKAPHLTPEAIVSALEAGEFYSTSGVLLRDLQWSGDRLRLEIEPKDGVNYRIEFIGTRRGFDATNEPTLTPQGARLRVTHRYSDDIGRVLKVVEGTAAEYRPQGDELYVRARVTSTQPKLNPYREGEFETAWIQPWVPVPPADAPARSNP
ncbi:MAG: hypothetical protein AB7O66_19135 [Limisphaerales bacterium]